jgi:leucyl aminopeptidase
MQVKVQAGDISPSRDAIVVNLFEGVASRRRHGAVDTAHGGVITNLIAAGDIRGKQGELTLIHSMGKLPAARVVVAGLGKASDFNVNTVLNLSGEIARYLRKQRIRNAAVIAHGAGIAGLPPEACAKALAEGTLLGFYRFTRHKKVEDEGELESLTIVERDTSKLPELERGVETGRILAEATNFCRDLANEPANYLTPTEMAQPGS